MPGLTEDGYSSSVLQPWGRDVPVYLANNDYAAIDTVYLFGDWAEETLLQVLATGVPAHSLRLNIQPPAILSPARCWCLSGGAWAPEGGHVSPRLAG